MPRCLVLGATGQIGRVAARRLADDGWDVTIAARHPPPDELAGFAFARVDRHAPGELEAAADGMELLIDVIAYSLDDGRQLASLAGRIGSVIVISTAAVYGLAARARPIVETDDTVPPGDDDYATRKRAIELMLLEQPSLRATLLRAGPCMDHGRRIPASGTS